MFFSSQVHQRQIADGSSSPLEWGIQEWEYFICRIRKLEWKMSSTTFRWRWQTDGMSWATDGPKK